MGLLVNMMSTRYEATDVKTIVGDAYERRVWTALPYSDDVAVLSSKDVLARHAPSHALVQLYHELMQDIMNE